MMRVEYVKCERRDAIVRKVPEQKRRKILCPECKVKRKREWWNWGEVVCPIQGKAQQGSEQTKAPKGTARERKEQKEVRRMFKILREI